MFYEMFVESRGARLFAAASLLVAMVAVASPAHAAEIDYTVQGRVTHSDFSEIPVNSSMTISYSVEDSTPQGSLTEADPTRGSYDGAITSLSVMFAFKQFEPPFYTIVGDPDATAETVNNVLVVHDVSVPRDSFSVKLGANSRSTPDGSLIGSGVSLGGVVPLRFDFFGIDDEAATLSDDSIDVTQAEFDRFVDRFNPATTATAAIAFVDADDNPAGFVVMDLDSVVVADGGQNAAPIADPGGPYLAAQDSVISFDGSGSSDPDGDSLTYHWDYGDDTTATGISSTHSYPTAGIYDVCLIVNDGTVDSTQVCTSAVIYDPSAGFVTGGGWIDSPAGAYAADPTLSGKATFAFVSKYKKGASTPTGNTQFQFHASDLNFHSTSYEWLVVTGGDSAVFKGEGSLNGVDGYKFVLWADDGDPDTFRIEISTDEDTVVYDNGSHQPISHGNVIVHSKN